MAEKAILFDSTKCTGCRACQVACKAWNDLETEQTTQQGWGKIDNPPDLSATTRLRIAFEEYSDTDAPDDLAWLFTRRACMHCTDAACAKVCPTGALYHHESGFVSFDRDKCSGCGYCINACPFGVPRAPQGGFSTVRKIDKCTFCADRVTDSTVTDLNAMPACVKTCPSGALSYGDRETLISTAKARVEALKARDAKYADAHLYGETELGGLHVLYVLPYEPETHGLPADPKVPATATVIEDVLPVVGYAVVGAVAVGLGVNYLVARARMNKGK